MKRMLIAALAVTLGNALSAQNKLTLDDCIRMAQAQNVEVLSKRLQTERAAMQVEARRHAFLPTLSGGIAHNIDFGRSADKTSVLHDRSSSNTSFSLSASMTLFSGFARLHDLKASRLQLEASRADLEQTYWDVRMEITQLYFAVLHARRVREIAQANVTRATEQTEFATIMVNGGKWSKDKLTDAEAQLATNNLRLVEAESSIAQAEQNLLLAMNSTTPFDIADLDIADEIARGTATLARDTAQRIELPALRANTLAQAAATAQIASARSGYLPSLSLSAGYSNSYYYLLGNEHRSLNLPFGEQWRNNGRQYIGLNLNIPIFDAFRTRNNIRAARMEALSLEIQRTRALRQQTKDLQQATLNANLALRKIEASRSNLTATETAAQMTQERWRVGRATANELSEANNRSMAAALEYLNAQYDFVLRTRLLSLYYTK